MNAGDYVRFRAVCKTWRCVSPRNLSPWLMLPCRDDDTKHGEFFSPSDSRVYRLQLPENFGKRCIGSSQGWLCFVEPNDLILTLYNPFTKAHIQLPSITTLPKFHVRVSKKGHTEYVWMSDRYVGDDEVYYCIEDLLERFFWKIILSENPTPNSFTAMLMYSQEFKLAFCRSGDTRWWLVESDPDLTPIHDAIYHQGRFYFLRGNATLSTVNTADPFDPNEKSITGTMNFPYPYERKCSADASGNINYPSTFLRKYLVEVSGELVMLFARAREPYNHEFIHITENRDVIYKTELLRPFKFIPELNEWTRMTSLGDYTLFVGINSSVSLSAKHVSPVFKPNCIYFTDRYENCIDDEVGGHDVGIFNLEDDLVEPLPYDAENPSCWIWPPPMWITLTIR